MTPELSTLTLGDTTLEVAHIPHPNPRGTILLLHEALGSVAYWRTFPQQLADATSSSVLLYSRAGHGQSTGPLALRTRAFYQREVEVTIPTLLDRFGVTAPILYGHSEGGVIAMVFAASNPSVRALIVESPFIQVHAGTGPFMTGMRAAYPGSDLQRSLAKYHRHPDDVFYSFIDFSLALSEDRLHLPAILPQIHAPLLLLQGEDDPFGTVPHRETLLALLPDSQVEVFPKAGHLPHRDQTAAVLTRTAAFLNQLT